MVDVQIMQSVGIARVKRKKKEMKEKESPSSVLNEMKEEKSRNIKSKRANQWKWVTFSTVDETYKRLQINVRDRLPQTVTKCNTRRKKTMEKKRKRKIGFIWPT